MQAPALIVKTTKPPGENRSGFVGSAVRQSATVADTGSSTALRDDLSNHRLSKVLLSSCAQKEATAMAESLREFLGRRERELLIELTPAENQVLAIRAELTEIRRAKASLEASANKLAEALRGSSVPDPTSPANTMTPKFGPLAATETGDSAALAAALSPFGFGSLSGVPLPLRQERLSIKQMILMVLEQEVKFRRHGATASEIRESIKNEFGREVEGTSLSPQLSRLRDDGYVDVHENRWKLTNPRAKTANNPNFVGRQMSSALHDHVNKAPPGDDPDSAPESPDVGK